MATPDPLNPFPPFYETPAGQEAKKPLLAAESDLRTQEATANQDIAALRAKAAQGPPQSEPFTMTEPQQNAQMVLQSAPLLIGLTALGGRLTHQTGLTMLKSTDAMFKGAVQGNQEAYDNAKAAYDQNFKKYLDREKQRAQVYKDVMAAMGDVVGADETALRIADKAVGDERANYKNAADQYAASMRATLQLASRKAAQQRSADSIKWFNASGKERDFINKVENEMPRLHTAYDTLLQSSAMWPKMVEKFQKEYGPNAVTPENVSSFIRKYEDDPEIGKFVSNINQIKSALVVIEAGSGMRSNQFVQTIFAKTAPDLFNMPASQITQQLKTDTKMVGEAVRNKDNILKSARARLAFANSKVPGLPDEAGDVGDTSELSVDDLLDKYAPRQ